MTSFRKTKDQAHHLTIKKSTHGQSRRHRQTKGISSISTEKKYMSCVKIFLDWCIKFKYPTSKITNQVCEEFLNCKATSCTQKPVDGYRQALDMIFNLKIDYVCSRVPTILTPRAYSQSQILFLIENSNLDLSFSIDLASACGLRAVELDTIARLEDFSENMRDWLPERFFGFDAGSEFVVIGKGGLRRKILIPFSLATRLESLRLKKTEVKTQRGIHYTKYYSIIGGHTFSQRFSRLSTLNFGWSTGAHGLRHSYAQQRIVLLMKNGFSYEYSLKIVSQELGHFSTTNTLTYLR